MCLIAIGACVIVNIAIDQKFTWSIYSVLSILLGWLVISPLAVKKYGVPLAFCSLTLFISPFLYFLEKVTPVDNWFSPLGLPAAITGIITIWLLYFLFRLIRINLWYKFAVAVLLAGAIAGSVINHYADLYLNTAPSFFKYFMNILLCVILAVLFGFFGYKKHKKAPPVQRAEQSTEQSDIKP